LSPLLLKQTKETCLPSLKPDGGAIAEENEREKTILMGRGDYF